MPQFKVTDPNSGKTLVLEGDSPPTEAELVDVFGKAQERATFTVSQPPQGELRPESARTIRGMPTVKGGPPISVPEGGDVGAQLGETLTGVFTHPGIVDASMVPSGAELTKATGIPKAVTVPASAVGKAAVSLAGYVTSGEGISMSAGALTPAAPVVFAKWAYDMIKGGYQSAADAVTSVGAIIRESMNRGMVTQNQLGIPAKATKDQIDQHVQALAEDAVNSAVGFLGGVGAAGHAASLTKAAVSKIAVSGAPATARAVEQTIGQANAKRIRSDEGPPETQGVQQQRGEADRRRDVEQAAPEQPQPVVAGEAQVTPAIQTPAGRVVTGEDHVTAYETAKATGTPDTSGSKEGFVDKASGEFITREAAAAKTGLPTETEPGKLHSSDLPKVEPPPEPQPTPEQEAAIAKGEAFRETPAVQVVGKVPRMSTDEVSKAVLGAVYEGGQIQGLKTTGEKTGHYVVAPPEKGVPGDEPMAIGPFTSKQAAQDFLDSEVGAPGAKVVEVRTAQPPLAPVAEKPAAPDVAEKWIREQVRHLEATGQGVGLDDRLKIVSGWIREGKAHGRDIPPNVQDALRQSLGPTKDLETGEMLDITSPDWPRTGTLINFLESQSQKRIVEPEYESISGRSSETVGGVPEAFPARSKSDIQGIEGAVPKPTGRGASGSRIETGLPPERLRAEQPVPRVLRESAESIASKLDISKYFPGEIGGQDIGNWERFKKSHLVPTIQLLQQNGWMTADEVASKLHKFRKPRDAASEAIGVLKHQDVAEVAWDKQGEPHYAIKGTELPNWLTQGDAPPTITKPTPAAPSPAQTPAQKQAWELTHAQWQEIRRGGNVDAQNALDESIKSTGLPPGKRTHENVLKWAIANGKDIPQVVLDESAGISTESRAKGAIRSEDQTPAQALGKESKVRIEGPEGATQIRITDKSGKLSVMPIAALNKNNTFQGVDIAKVEAGIIGKDKKFQAVKGEVKVDALGFGPGSPAATQPMDVGGPQEAQLLSALNQLPAGAKGIDSPRINIVTKIAEELGSHKKTIGDWWLRTKAGAEQFKRLLMGSPPIKGDFWGVKGDWTANRQVNSATARELIETGKRLVPKPLNRQAMGKYAEALMVASDPESGFKSAEDVLAHWSDSSSLEKNKQRYEKAKSLTEEQKAQVRQSLQYWEAKGQELVDAGLLNHLIEDYAGQHMVDMRVEVPPSMSTLRADLVAGRLGTNFKYALRRVFETEFDLEQKGYKLKTTDLYDKLANYALSANNVLADRAAVKAWMEGETSNGRPFFATGVGRRLVEGVGEKKDALLVNPKIRPDPKVKDAQGNLIDVSHEYVKFDHPAFRKWQWAETEPDGKQVFVQGDIWVHKSIAPELANSLGRSKLYEIPGVDTLTRVNAQLKGIKLVGFFHQVKTGSHALFHLTRPWGQPKIDFHDPFVYDAMRNGLQLAESRSAEMFSEGLASSAIIHRIPGIGPFLRGYQEYLFHDYIPRIKLATYRNALERNQKRYGKVLDDQQLKQITATQVNSAFGELNWRLLGVNPTFQHALRLSVLAPDFQAAQTGFAAQIFTKYGGEQRMAAAVMIGSVYIGARIANQILDNDPHWEWKRAFGVVHNGREYGIRTIATDAQRAFTNTAQFFYHRLSPMASALTEWLTKIDALGRKETPGQARKNILLRAVPIPVTPRDDLNFIESAISSTFGFYEKRQSHISDIIGLAQDWRKKNDPNYREEAAQYPESRYRGLRQALSDNDAARARREYEALVKSGLKPSRITAAMTADRPFAGSRANERKFKQSLNKEQQLFFEEAKKEQGDIKKRYRAMDKTVDNLQ